jgi:phosphate starvation-inducible PhoH-like protein
MGKKNRGKESSKKLVEQNLFLNFEINQRFNLSEVHKSFVECGLNPESKILFCDGLAGTSKSYLSVYCALELLKRREVERIVYIRSLTESGKRLLGSLPGEVDDKFKPWSIPLLEKCDELINISVTNALLQQHVIKSTPINYLRGVTFNDAAVIVDEFQNLVKEEATTVLSRFGKNCKMFVVGDSMQSDIAEKSGFKKILQAFDTEESRQHGIHTFYFGENEITRSKMLKYIVKVLQNIPNDLPPVKNKK